MKWKLEYTNEEKQDDMARFVSIWFCHLTTDWFSNRQPQLRKKPFVFKQSSHGRMVIVSTNEKAQQEGIYPGMVLADARAIFPDLQDRDEIPDLHERLLKRIAEWCIRFTPVAAIDPPDGILLDVSGCSHLWGGDNNYVETINRKLTEKGYQVRIALADTIGAAWALARFSNDKLVISSNEHSKYLLQLPVASLRVAPEVTDQLNKLGLTELKHLVCIPAAGIRRRFGKELVKRMNQVFGKENEPIVPVIPIEPYQERLPCLDPILTAAGISIATKKLLEATCSKLRSVEKGLRLARLRCLRLDGITEEISIGTNRPTHNADHIFKLFEIKLETIAPGPGIEIFILDALKVEDLDPQQEELWKSSGGLDHPQIGELLDRIENKLEGISIKRFLPNEHYWPESSCKLTSDLLEKSTTNWRENKQRPVLLLKTPERIKVTAPIPDYPPMLFIYKNKLHKIIKADGPERIEQEWWIRSGEHRDYYAVEDEEGSRYWLFRLGHYQSINPAQWFIHGFFA